MGSTESNSPSNGTDTEWDDVHCSYCSAAVAVDGGFALPEEWALEFGWTHDVLNKWVCPDHCRFRPFPDSGAYGHWICGLRPEHDGRHRFRSYTIARIPHLHKGLALVTRAWLRQKRRQIRHLAKYRKWPGEPLRPAYGLHWRSAIWPTKYEPQHRDPYASESDDASR